MTVTESLATTDLEFARQLGDGLADQLLIVGQLETHPAGHDDSPLVNPAQTSTPMRERFHPHRRT